MAGATGKAADQDIALPEGTAREPGRQLFCFRHARTRAVSEQSMIHSEPRQPSRNGEQRRALWLSTIAFTVCFAVWTIFSIIGIRIKEELGLSETEFGLLRRHADPHRIAGPHRARRLDRPLRRPSRLHRDDARGGGGDLPARLTPRPIRRCCSPRSASASPAAPSPSASPMCRASSRRRSRAPRSAFSASAMSARRSPSSSRPSFCWPGAGRRWR